MTLYRKVFTKDRLPADTLSPIEYHTNAGRMYGGFIDESTCIYWLEKIELPSDDEILSAILLKQDKDQTQFMRGIDYILNKLKG